MRKDDLVLRATIRTVFNQRKAKGWYIEDITYATLSLKERNDIKAEAKVICIRRIGV